jgi:hypothetical protein
MASKKVEGNQDDSVEPSSKFLVNISGYYMAVDVRSSLNKLENAIHARIDRGDEFRELMLQRLFKLQDEVRQPVENVNVDALKGKIQELATLLNSSDIERFPTATSGGRRNFRRYSRRKRR